MNLKKIIRKDADGNSMSFEFDIPKANVPPVDSIPNYDHPGEPRGSDTVPAWLTPGENIVNAEASRLPGNQQIIDQMNNQGRAIQAQQGGSIPTYADGGGFIDIARTATDYAPYVLASIGLPASLAGLWGMYKSNRDAKNWKPIGWDPTRFKAEGGVVYAEEGTKPAPDTSWVDGILDALRFVESGEITDPSKLISPAGAEGFYQIMPANFGELTEKDEAGKVTKTYKGKGAAGYNTPVITREDAYNPEKARAWAKAYLTNMQLAHPEWSPADVLRAYNWGPGNMKQFMKEGISWDEVPTEAKEYTDKVFKHYKKLTGEDFYDTTSNAPELAGLRDAIPVPGEMDIPSGDLSMADLTIPAYSDDTSVEIDTDGPGQNLKIGPGGAPNMPMNFMGSVNPRKGYESSEDYMNTYGIVDPLSGRLRPPRYEGGAIMPGMEDLYQQYPIDLTPDHWPTMEEIVKGPAVPPQAEVDPTGRMERMVDSNVALANRQAMLDEMSKEMDLQEILEKAERGEYGPFPADYKYWHENADGSGTFGPFPGASIDGDEFAKAAGAVGLPTDNDTLNQIVDMVNRENISPQEAAAKIKEMSITPLTNTIQGPDTDPNALEVDPANYLFTSGAGVDAGPIPDYGTGNTLSEERGDFIKGPWEVPQGDGILPVPLTDFGAGDLNLPESLMNLGADPKTPEGYQDPMQATYAIDKKKADEEKSKIKAAITNKEFMEKSGFEGAGEDIRYWWNKIIPDFGLEEANVSISELVLSPESALEKINKHKEKLNQDKISKEKYNKHYNDLLETFKNKKAEEVSEDLSGKGNQTVTQSTTEVEAAWKEAYKNGRGGKNKLPPENKIVGFFKELLGDVFDTKELKRAAVMYLGGRLLGYDHSSAGGYAVKNMLTRMQTEEANRAANIKAWAGTYTPASLELYKKSGDLNDLSKVGATSNPQGTFDRFHRRNKDGTWTSVDAEKHTIGEGANKKVVWRTRDGGIIGQGALTGFTERDDNVPGEKAYRETWNNMVDVIKQPIQDIRNQKDRYGKNENIKYYTGDGTSAATLANQTASFAVDRGLTVQQVADLAPLAYENMIQFAKGSGKKPSDITPFLEEIIIKHRTGDKTLFEVEPSKEVGGIGKPMSTELFNTMSSSIETIIRQRAIKENKDNPYFVPPMAISSYINHYATVWNGVNKTDKHAKNFQGKNHWNDKALDDTTGFYEWLTEVVIPADFNAMQ